MSVQQVYDFESILSTAFTTVLAAAGLTVVNLNVTPTLQKPRPRVDLFFHSHGLVVPVIFVNGQTTGDWPRGAAYRGELKLQCSTDVNAEGKSVHAAYRALVRSLGAVLGNLVNIPSLQFKGSVGNSGGDTVASFTSLAPHGLAVGQGITIYGAAHSLFNGKFSVVSVTDAFNFSYTLSAPAGPANDLNVSGYASDSLALPYHKVQFIVEGATTFSIAPDKSYETSTLSYNVDFSVQNNAWPLLDTP